MNWKKCLWISAIFHAVALPLLFALTVNERTAPDKQPVMLLLQAPENVVTEKSKPEIAPPIPAPEPVRAKPNEKIEPRKTDATDPVKIEAAPIPIPAEVQAPVPATNTFSIAQVVDVLPVPEFTKKTVETFQPKPSRTTSAQPRYRENPEPVYPTQAKRRRQEGSVLLDAAVDESGKATKVELIQSSGFTLLDESAIEAVRRWQFEPAKIDERPVASSVEIPISFRLSK